MATACGVLGITAGSLGLIGVQTRSVQKLVYIRYTRVVQILLVLIANLIVLLNLDDIPEETIPTILRASIDVQLSLQLACLSSVVFWTTLWMYGLVLVQRLIRVIEAGFTPAQSLIVFLSGPTGLESRIERRVQYESPLLQGRIVTVPTSVE